MNLFTITSVHNPRVKEAAKLRDHRQRHKQQRTLIDGQREIERAFAAGVELVEVFVCDAACHESRHATLVKQLGDAGVNPLGCTPEVFAKVAFGERAEGVVAVAAVPRTSLSQLQINEDALVAVLVGLEKPGNVGGILRSADAAGIDAVIVADGGTDLFNPNTIRASLGTIFTVPIATASTTETLAWLTANRFRTFTARVDASIEYTQANFRGRAAVVLGSESQGLPPAWHTQELQAIRLPMRGIADSLNVSATAAVLFYEALRQRG
jgi:TrmH family RNA methyltransferase